ncbi:MAG: 16S rRNA (cytosine(1402)-N(4))-methyltransferase RsmH [Alphaproteobacteria bacterium]|nr:16S rRNA (cytosine(1402)-N(4))-methyltransferase RsmH [Alphaproteobacteria bacterium]MBV9694629.1 16S rRNA (cytosine(1402)-N(4))-methyltransferase RsmH [Alphaproteobacteria bacterium]
MSAHVPVMLTEVLEALAPRDGGRYVDGTFGGGGYAKAILEAARCQVFAIDRDPDAIARGAALKERFAGRLTLILGRFSAMDSIVDEPVDGVVLDLGVSSFQFDEAERGFSFRADGPLDMRMGIDGESAGDFVNRAEETAIADVLYRYGEERKARSIARAIVAARPVTRTAELAAIVERALGPAARRFAVHPATRTFQALRIHVNDELGELERGLEAATRTLAHHGRLVVVSFHSLEDRIVKRFLVGRSAAAARPSRHAPQARSRASAPYRLIAARPRTPSALEIERNPRARSARLRAAERLRAEVGA